MLLKMWKWKLGFLVIDMILWVVLLKVILFVGLLMISFLFRLLYIGWLSMVCMWWLGMGLRLWFIVMEFCMM